MDVPALVPGCASLLALPLRVSVILSGFSTKGEQKSRARLNED